MALCASILERMAGQTTAFVEHGQLCVSACLKICQRHVGPGQLVVTPVAEIGVVAKRTARSIDRGVFAVNVVLPAGGVRRRKHHLVAGHALMLGGRRG